MSSEATSAAIERICTDPSFAQAVAEQGAEALASLELTGSERDAIVEALSSDLAEVGGDEVEGFGIHVLAGLPFNNLMALNLAGQPGGGGAGKFGAADPDPNPTGPPDRQIHGGW